jgi:hypothetical protein
MSTAEMALRQERLVTLEDLAVDDFELLDDNTPNASIFFDGRDQAFFQSRGVAVVAADKSKLRISTTFYGFEPNHTIIFSIKKLGKDRYQVNHIHKQDLPKIEGILETTTTKTSVATTIEAAWTTFRSHIEESASYKTFKPSHELIEAKLMAKIRFL